MASQDQMMADAAQKHLSIEQGSKITTQLKGINKQLTALHKIEKYGIQEDQLFAAPHKATAECISRLTIARSKDIHKLHNELEHIQNRLKFFNKHMTEHQKLNYRYALTKKRNKE
jgi:hypothetical protein